MVFDRQGNGKGLISKDTMISALFLGATYYLLEIKILHEKRSERAISDSRKEFQILGKVYKNDQSFGPPFKV